MADPQSAVLLQRPERGQDVIHLQSALAAESVFNGDIDGAFGRATEEAVTAFQIKQGLAATGTLTEETAARLGWRRTLPETSTLPEINTALVARAFTPAARPNIEVNLPSVVNALAAVGLVDRQMVAMALGTVRVESGLFLPVSELESKFNTSPGGRPFDLYDERIGLGNSGAPDGSRFRGRGFVQLTGRSNYETFGRRIGMGDALVKNPFLAHQTSIAAKLLAAFLQQRESRIRATLRSGRLGDARKLVNGGSNGLADFVTAFQRIYEALPANLDRAA